MKHDPNPAFNPIPQFKDWNPRYITGDHVRKCRESVGATRAEWAYMLGYRTSVRGLGKIMARFENDTLNIPIMLLRLSQTIRTLHQRGVDIKVLYLDGFDQLPDYKPPLDPNAAEEKLKEEQISPWLRYDFTKQHPGIDDPRELKRRWVDATGIRFVRGVAPFRQEKQINKD